MERACRRWPPERRRSIFAFLDMIDQKEKPVSRCMIFSESQVEEEKQECSMAEAEASQEKQETRIRASP